MHFTDTDLVSTLFSSSPNVHRLHTSWFQNTYIMCWYKMQVFFVSMTSWLLIGIATVSFTALVT